MTWWFLKRDSKSWIREPTTGLYQELTAGNLTPADLIQQTDYSDAPVLLKRNGKMNKKARRNRPDSKCLSKCVKRTGLTSLRSLGCLGELLTRKQGAGLSHTTGFVGDVVHRLWLWRALCPRNPAITGSLSKASLTMTLLLDSANTPQRHHSSLDLFHATGKIFINWPKHN